MSVTALILILHTEKARKLATQDPQKLKKITAKNKKTRLIDKTNDQSCDSVSKIEMEVL